MTWLWVRGLVAGASLLSPAWFIDHRLYAATLAAYVAAYLPYRPRPPKPTTAEQIHTDMAGVRAIYAAATEPERVRAARGVPGWRTR